MAKDPAFLFYPGDASEDTQFMNRLERGAYFDLLKAQKKFGKFTKDQIKKVLGGDFETCWSSLELVLTQHEGFYYIEWVAEKIEERKAFSESRRKNRSKKDEISTSEQDLLNISETSNKDMVVVIEDELNYKKESDQKLSLPKGGFKPGPEFTDLVINPVQVGAAQQYLKLTKQVDATTDTVLGLWQVFKVKKFNGTNWYNDVGDVYTNFMNSLKFEKLENFTPPKKPSGPTPAEIKAQRILNHQD